MRQIEVKGSNENSVLAADGCHGCSWPVLKGNKPAGSQLCKIMYYFLSFSKNRQKHIWWMWCFRKPSNTHRHTHAPNSAYTMSVLISPSSTSITHTPVNISDDHLLLPHINTPTITILVCFMPLLCSLSQILQYLCVQQYFNKEYQNWYMQDFCGGFFCIQGHKSNALKHVYRSVETTLKTFSMIKHPLKLNTSKYNAPRLHKPWSLSW